MTDNPVLKSEETPKRKRGRPPKTPSNTNTLLEFPISHLTEKEAKELQLGYKILKDILIIPKIKHLLDKPDESYFGLHDYYSVIEDPIWFNEISHKFTTKKYKDLKTVINDIRLVLENCYKFWGDKHKFIKQAYKVEKLLEKHISEFPEHLKQMCSLGEPEKPTMIKKIDSESDTMLTEEYHSKILENLEKKQKENKENMFVDPDLLKWETEVLMRKQKSKQLFLISELAEIGQFLRLSKDILGLKDITQYEVERMLLMSKESTTLASIMTSLLCPTAMRGSSLYFKPIMVYNVWMQLLQRKMESWYTSYAKVESKLQMFVKYGIEPFFWEIVGEKNPLVDNEFSALSLSKKACILKALCTTMFHSNKKIEDYINSLDDTLLRGTTIFEDSKFEYVSLFAPDIRIYRTSKIQLDIEHIIETVLPNFKGSNKIDLPEASDQTSEQKNVCSKRQKFYLVASNKESLKSLLKVVSKKKKSVSAIHNLLDQDESDKHALRGLKAMFSQWKKSIDRSAVEIENSLNYWIKKEPSPERIPQNAVSAISQESGAGVESVLGKRVLKRTFPLEEVESSSNDEKLSEDNVSDWEDGNIKRNRRVKPPKSVPRFFDRRFMKFERQDLEVGISREEFKPICYNASTPKPTLMPKISRRINFLSRSGVSIKRTSPHHMPQKSAVNIAIDNVCKLITHTPLDKNTKVLTIDIKEENKAREVMRNDDLHYSWPNRLPLNRFSYYTPQKFPPFEKAFLHASQMPASNKPSFNQSAPSFLGDYSDYTLVGQNEMLQNFQSEQSLSDPDFYKIQKMCSESSSMSLAENSLNQSYLQTDYVLKEPILNQNSAQGVEDFEQMECETDSIVPEDGLISIPEVDFNEIACKMENA